MSLANRFNPYQWYVWLQRKGEYFNKSNFQCKMQENLPVLHSLYMCQRVYSFTSSAGKSSAIMIWPFTQNRWHLFLYEWTTTKGTIYVVKGVSSSLSFRFFFCKCVCLVFFLLVYLIVTLICLVSWLFVCLFFCMFLCLFFFIYVCLSFSFVCFFFLVYNVCVFDHVNAYSSFDQSFLS